MKIELSDTEITHIMDALRERVNDLRDAHSISGDIETADLANELEELEHDLFEAMSRPPGCAEHRAAVASGQLWADDMIQAGIDAREQIKASSMAAQRREQALSERLMEGTTGTLANDPIDW